jgi:hypothetical protein
MQRPAKPRTPVRFRPWPPSVFVRDPDCILISMGSLGATIASAATRIRSASAPMAKLVYARDLKSLDPHRSCRFDSGSGHQISTTWPLQRGQSCATSNPSWTIWDNERDLRERPDHQAKRLGACVCAPSPHAAEVISKKAPSWSKRGSPREVPRVSITFAFTICGTRQRATWRCSVRPCSILPRSSATKGLRW